MAIGKMMQRMERVFLNKNTIGIMEYPNGDKYEGDFANDQKNGQGKYHKNLGVYTFKNNDKYEGDFKNDKKEGKGKKPYSYRGIKEC